MLRSLLVSTKGRAQAQAQAQAQAARQLQVRRAAVLAERWEQRAAAAAEPRTEAVQ
jgi:hypothetical protein